jgi:hypothetical protein
MVLSKIAKLKRDTPSNFLSAESIPKIRLSSFCVDEPMYINLMAYLKKEKGNSLGK